MATRSGRPPVAADVHGQARVQSAGDGPAEVVHQHSCAGICGRGEPIQRRARQTIVDEIGRDGLQEPTPSLMINRA
jgi:hypothetical protein